LVLYVGPYADTPVTAIAWRLAAGVWRLAQLIDVFGPPTAPHEDAPMAKLILHVHREVIHHGAEISLLRGPSRGPNGRED
jgi:hypothetical protein